MIINMLLQQKSCFCYFHSIFLCHMGNNGHIIPVHFKVAKERVLTKA